MTEITDHLAQIFERVARAAERARRSPSSVTIVAIAKQQPASAIAEAQRAGIENFGESYVQEALPKIAALADLPVSWHFVGKMQANKTRQVAEAFDWVHTVDRLKIAERLSEQRSPFAAPLNVLIQVNQGGEPFNNLFVDSKVQEVVDVDFAAHGAAMGCLAETVSSIPELEAAFGRARAADRTTVIAIKTSAYEWTEGGSFWEVGVPEVSEREGVRKARAALEEGKAAQRVGW